MVVLRLVRRDDSDDDGESVSTVKTWVGESHQEVFKKLGAFMAEQMATPRLYVVGMRLWPRFDLELSEAS